jgi:hypothetical protein
MYIREEPLQDRLRVLGIASEPVNTAYKTEALLDDGRVVAFCPLPGCYGAELLHPEDRLFFCTSCQNRPLRQPIPLIWPPEILRRAQVSTSVPPSQLQLLIRAARDIANLGEGTSYAEGEYIEVPLVMIHNLAEALEDF